MSETYDEPVVERSSPSLGERLRQAREAKKYTVAEVAAQLRLTKDIVIYLENQNWERLNGRTYARGYFASYVKFLGLPYEEMLAVFNLEYTATEPELNLRQHGHSVHDKSLPWFILVLIVVLLVVAWLGYQRWQNSQLFQKSALDTSEETTSMPRDEFNDSVVEPILNTPTLAETENDEVIPAFNEATLAATVDELGLSDDSLDEINATEELDSAESSDSETTDAPEVSQPAESEQATASTLRLSFSGECWVEVTNADAKVLVSKVMQARDSLELSSQQPLSILLGRADAATVVFNNQQVDLKPFTQGVVARLTLGVES